MSPTHHRGPAVDAAILASALAEIEATGTMSISIESVARRTGVNKTTVYRRWPTSDALVVAAIGQLALDSVPIPDTGDLESDLRTLCRAVREIVDSPTGRALIGAGRSPSPELESIRTQFWHERFRLAAAIIDRARERGDEVPDGDAVEQLERLMAPIHFRLIELNKPVTDSYIDRLVSTWLAAR